MKTVLLTGSGGKVGQALAKGLRDTGRYKVISTGRRPDQERGIIKLDVRDLQACVQAFKGVDTVVHCAFNMTDMGRNNFVQEQIPTNFVGSYNVYEAALANNVQRVIFASSNHAVGFYKSEDKVNEDSPMRPDSFYGIAKCFNEILGYYYADRYGISCINLRIGNLSAQDRPVSPRTTLIYLSHRDCVQIIDKSISAPAELKKGTFFAVSCNTGGFLDITKAREILGYEPQDNGADYMEEAKRINALGGADETGYMGGALVNLS